MSLLVDDSDLKSPCAALSVYHGAEHAGLSVLALLGIGAAFTVLRMIYCCEDYAMHGIGAGKMDQLKNLRAVDMESRVISNRFLSSHNPILLYIISHQSS